ncbi:polysaccharide deacetylase family protein [Streptomyces jumonjinensis]|uniref:polysaccharide deacetylase family protein n=1 Tax=Streptomyces jumonjinensis TaxID=1945 RepID=UPI0037B9574F
MYTGISWSSAGYEVAVIDANGLPARAPAQFPPGGAGEMIDWLRGLGPGLVHVVESTNGILDGRMMAAGLDVYRADPHLLPGRPLFGSVPAGVLAGAGLRELSALTRLVPTRGTQTGREAELDTWIESSEGALAELTRTGRALSHGGRDRPEIALTFDDGPLPPYTGLILDVLGRYGVPATFFCVGMNVTAYAGDIARMREQGHAVANHTWSHPMLPELTRPQLIEQLERTKEAVAEAGAPAPTLFRPPYGSRTPEVLGWLAETDARVVLWDVAADDWAMPGADAIARRILGEARPGSIVLLHDGGGDRSQTVAALPAVIEGLLGRGYRFVLAQELLDRSAAAPGPGTARGA